MERRGISGFQIPLEGSQLGCAGSSFCSKSANCKSYKRRYVPSLVIKSSWLPISAIAPFSITTIRSARRTVESRCAITNTVRPLIRLCNADCTKASDSLSRADVASSRIRMGAFFNISGAIAMRWRSPANFESDIVQHASVRALAAIGEAHVIELDGIRESRQAPGMRLLADIVFHIDELEDFAGSAEGLLEIIVEQGELADRIVEAEHSCNQGYENSWSHLAVLDLFAAQVQQQSDSDDTEDIHQR